MIIIFKDYWESLIYYVEKYNLRLLPEFEQKVLAGDSMKWK